MRWRIFTDAFMSTAWAEWFLFGLIVYAIAAGIRWSA